MIFEKIGVVIDEAKMSIAILSDPERFGVHGYHYSCHVPSSNCKCNRISRLFARRNIATQENLI